MLALDVDAGKVSCGDIKRRLQDAIVRRRVEHVAAIVVVDTRRSSLAVRATHKPSEKLINVGLSSFPGEGGTQCLRAALKSPTTPVFDT